MSGKEREQWAAAEEQFSRQSGNYGVNHILADTSDLEHAFGHVALRTGMRALDVATGGGHTARWLAARGCLVTASDLSAAMLERTRELLAMDGKEVELRRHTAEEMPYPDKSFDVLTCRVAAHHFADKSRFVREAARVLKPDGVFVLIDGSAPDGAPEAAEWLHQVEKLRDPSHGAFGSPAEWRALAGAAGFQITECFTTPMKQPDVEWYFATAGTSEENRRAVYRLLEEAPARAREIFSLQQEEGRWVWWWPRMTLVARLKKKTTPKPGPG